MTTRHARNAYSLVLPIVLLAAGCNPDIAAQSALEEPGRVIASGADTVAGGGGLNLAVYQGGRNGGPAIVFIHGFSQNSTTWEQQLAGSLARQFHLVTFDMRGHGASDKPLLAEQYTDASLWADDIAAVIRAANLQRPVLVGWSYGGYVIADYVRKYGDDALGGLVFVDAVTKNGTEEAVGYLTEEVLGIFGDVFAADIRRSLDASGALAGLFTARGSAAWETAFGSAMMVPPAVRGAMFGRVLDNDDILAGINVPTLVVHGGADRVVRVSAAEHTARTVPGAKLIVYDGLGHAPHLDDPKRFERDLAAFVQTVRRDKER